MSVFSIHSGTGDVEAVMGSVAEALLEWETGKSLPLDLSTIHDSSDRLAEDAHNLWCQWNLDNNAIVHSTRPGLGPWIIRFQLLVRRLTRWFLEPILQQIRVFQMNATRLIMELARNQRRLAARFDAASADAASKEDWMRRIEVLEAQVKELQRQVTEREGQDAG
jgi:hypothetical protein